MVALSQSMMSDSFRFAVSTNLSRRGSVVREHVQLI